MAKNNKTLIILSIVCFSVMNFIKWTCPAPYFGTIHYQFWGYQDENLKLVKQQYIAWSYCPLCTSLTILMVKANHFWFQQCIGLENRNSIKLIEGKFLFLHVYIIIHFSSYMKSEFFSMQKRSDYVMSIKNLPDSIHSSPIPHVVYVTLSFCTDHGK
jgi:hypothetical protein